MIPREHEPAAPDSNLSEKLHRLAATFAAEILPPHARGALTGTTSLCGVLEEHLVLVFRGCENLTVREQIAATRLFGAIDTPWDPYHRHPEDDRVQIISNANRAGITYKSSTLYWHSDQSFTAAPTPVTILRAVELPRRGGRTLFADLRTAYEHLPNPIREQCRNLRAEHSFSHLMAPLMDKRQGKGKGTALIHRYPNILHPLVITHAITRRQSLYMSELCITRLLPIPDQESTALLTYLYDHALQERYLYAHQWQPGDVVVWYNPGLMHRAEEIPATEPRIFHRTNTRFTGWENPCS